MHYLRHPATIIAAVALFVGLGGGAAAYASGLISGSQIKNHSIAEKKLTKSAIKALRGQRGPKGATGAQGPQGQQGQQGQQGPPGTARGYAFVNSDGSIVTSGGSISITVNHIATGEYCLITSPSVGTYAPIVATLQGQDFTQGMISVNTSFGSDCNPYGGEGVFTMNTAGTPTDMQFVVAVM
jgi:hypothetical protein